MTWPEPVESFEIRSVKWAWHQLRKHPTAIFSNRTFIEALLTPIARWHYALVLPIAGLFGVITIEPPFGGRLYLVTCGLFLLLLGMIAPRIYQNPRLLVTLAKSAMGMNPHTVRVMISTLKGAGVAMIAYSLGTIVHQAFTVYELIAVAVSMTLLIGAIVIDSAKYAWHPVLSTPDYLITGKTYTNHTYGFSVSVPEDWEIKTGRTLRGVLIVFASPENDVSINVAVNAMRIPNPSPLPIIDIAEDYVRRIYSSLRPYEQGTIIRLSVARNCKDFPAITVDYPFLGRHHRKVALFLKVHSYAGYEYLFTYGAPKDKFDKYEHALNHCLSTFSLASFIDPLVSS